MAGSLRILGVAAVIGSSATLAPLSAQEPSSPGTPTQAADTTTAPVDSTRIRVLEHLNRLARPPGVDSVEIRAMEDSLALIDARNRSRSPMSGRPGSAPPGGARAPTAAADPTLTALFELPGYAVTEYQGDLAHLDSDRRLVLSGAEGTPAVIRRPEGEVRSDTVIYDPRSERMRTQGGQATLIPSQGDELTSERLIFDTGEQRGTALGAVTTYTQGGEWTVRGDLPSVNPDVVYGSHARFTSCQLDEPHYHFQAGEVKIHGGNWLVARPVVLYFDDVPVAWLPFIAQGLGDGRSSGLLTPRFSLNDIVRNSEGYSRRISNVGFYWATNDYMDMALAMDWWANNYTSLTGSYRYSWLKQFLNGGINYRQFWRVDGRQELAFDTQHSWAPDERTNLRLSAQFSSNNDFVRENSFDPRETTGSIDSNGGISRRFSWGTATVGGNRRQFLSDDRVETTVPTVNLSLSPMTFFQAPSNRASWYSNLTWSGGGSFNRSEIDLSEVPDSLFTPALADQRNTRASANSAFNLGALSFSQNFGFTENLVKDVPNLYLNPLQDTTAAQALLSPIDYGRQSGSFLDEEPTTVNLASADINWSMSLDYQQRLIGSTTITPALAISGQSRSSDEAVDSIPELSGFVAAPMRISAGAQLKTDIYGFWPGFSNFEAIRHKFSPTFTWAYTPASTPSDLQREVFRVDDLRTKNELRIGLNQTFEAKRQPTEEEAAAADAGFTFPDSLAALPDSVIADSFGITVDSVATLRESLPPERDEEPGGPRRQERSTVVKLLALNTSAVTYDFVRADSLGSFDQGFETTRISNQISSDFLRGFTISLEHELFKDVISDPELPPERTFDPHLTQLNLGFSIGSSSGIFRMFRGGDDSPNEPIPADQADPFAVRSGTDEDRMIPGRAGDALSPRDRRNRAGQGAGVGGWNANISYSLTRPRDTDLAQNQMIQWTMNFKPTLNWDLSWRSSYDIENSRFNDHIVRLSRDLHRWEANFDFRQSTNGNWSFRFEVALIDNRDLKFDYNQRDQSAFGR
jgi:hypothetical protein